MKMQRGLVFIDVECFFEASTLGVSSDRQALPESCLQLGMRRLHDRTQMFRDRFDIVLVCEQPGPKLYDTRRRFPKDMWELICDATWEQSSGDLPVPRHLQILDYLRYLGSTSPGRHWLALDSDASQWPRVLHRHVIGCAHVGFGLEASVRMARQIRQWPVIPQPDWDEAFRAAEAEAERADADQGTQDANEPEPPTGFVRLFPREALKKVCELPTQYGGDRRRGYQRIADSLSAKPQGYRRMLSLPCDMDQRLNLLAREMPNFQRVIEALRLAFRLQSAGDGYFKFAPILLGGPPGVGKTYFARQLAMAFGSAFRQISMETTTAGFVLSGMSSKWGESSPGLIFDTLVHGQQANPMILLDELDKVWSEQRHSPLKPLYGLLEPMSAKTFTDEYCPELPVDTSHINWIVTANEVEKIPEPLLNRMVRVDVPEPTQSERMGILRCLYRDMRAQEAWGKHFDDELPEPVAERLCLRQGSVRDLRHLLLMAFAHAIARGSGRLILADLAPAGGYGWRANLQSLDALREMKVQGHA